MIVIQVALFSVISCLLATPAWLYERKKNCFDKRQILIPFIMLVVWYLKLVAISYYHQASGSEGQVIPGLFEPIGIMPGFFVLTSYVKAFFARREPKRSFLILLIVNILFSLIISDISPFPPE